MTNLTNKPCVLALGFFDGVHRGHMALLQRTAQRAEELGVESVALTFDTHPDTLVYGDDVDLINSMGDRAWLMRNLCGIRQVVFFPFTEESMRLPWADFLDIICADTHCIHLVVGYDFRFGWRGNGDAERLREYCRRHGLGCDIIPRVDVQGVTVSSTYIRRLLLAGDMTAANAFLGHPHILTDTVRRGWQLGRRMDAPTVNMRFPPGVLVPRHGVYATRVRLPEGDIPSVTNIGVRPTVSVGDILTVETHLLDYSGNLYGRTLILEFYEHLRDEIKFSSVEELSAQIAVDSDRARKILEGHPCSFAT